MIDVTQVLVQGFTQGLVYALLAMGIALVYRTTRVLNFAHGELLIVAVFILYVLNTNPIKPIPYGAAVVIALVVTILLGMLEYLVAVKSSSWAMMVVVTLAAGWLLAGTYGAFWWIIVIAAGAAVTVFAWRHPAKPLEGSLGWILGTIAFAIILQEGLVTAIGATEEQQAIPGLFGDLGPLNVGGVIISGASVATAACAIVIIVALDLVESRTRFGRAMKAVAYDEDAAALMGINVPVVLYGAFALAAAAAAIAGFLITPLTFAQPTGGPAFTVIALTAALLGGIDRVRTAAIGGLLLGMIEIGLGRFLDTLGRMVGDGNIPLRSLRDAIVLSLLIAILVFRPRGLFGSPGSDPLKTTIGGPLASLFGTKSP